MFLIARGGGVLKIGVRVYPYGIFDPWAQWDWAWMGLENSSAVVVVVVAAAAAVAPLENH